ncbi:MAG TPA: VWA domain-containing protein [Devosia sp.]|jgi:Ca-activated chloride channel family protein|nr:VWA domain-containing protein [Devosia sp.]
MMRHLLRLFAGLVAVTALAVPALAADKAMIILDASGSMWAQINGVSRIEMARDSLKQVLAGVPSDLELGFMAYGHRSKGDCNDIETLVEPAAGTADSIVGAAMALNPKGKTPLSAAVKRAAEQLKYTENKATVVLITDGIETCDADPCALATELAKDGVDFKVNVVGFGLSQADGAKVKCLADNTHGTYISADDADGLKNAIDVAVNNTPPPEPAAPSSSEEPATDITFAPTAVLTEGGDTLVDGDGNIAWEFYSVKADGSQGDWVRTEYGNAYRGAIEPGEYWVNAKLDYAHVELKLTIEAGKTATPVFDLEAGHIDLRPRMAEGEDINSGAAVYTEFPDGTSTTSYGEVSIYVPAGDTKVTVTIGSAVINDVVSVAAGDRVEKDLVVGAGHINITGSFAEGQPIGDSVLFVEVFDAKKDIQGNRKSVANGYGPTISLDLAPGDYVAVASYDAVKVEQPFSIRSGEGSDLDINLNAGALAVTAPNGNYVEIFSAKKDIQGNRTSFGGTYDMAATRTLPPGDYHIVVTLANDAGTKEADASVKAGERTEITVE